jgi:hypothetical protein
LVLQWSAGTERPATTPSAGQCPPSLRPSPPDLTPPLVHHQPVLSLPPTSLSLHRNLSSRRSSLKRPGSEDRASSLSSRAARLERVYLDPCRKEVQRTVELGGSGQEEEDRTHSEARHCRSPPLLLQPPPPRQPRVSLHSSLPTPPTSLRRRRPRFRLNPPASLLLLSRRRSSRRGFRTDSSNHRSGRPFSRAGEEEACSLR